MNEAEASTRKRSTKAAEDGTLEAVLKGSAKVQQAGFECLRIGRAWPLGRWDEIWFIPQLCRKWRLKDVGGFELGFSEPTCGALLVASGSIALNFVDELTSISGPRSWPGLF